MKKILLILILLGVGFILILYITLKPNTRNIATDTPFKEIIGKELVLNKAVYIILQEKGAYSFEPYAIFDSNYNNSQIIQHATEKPQLLQGSKLHITGAKMYQSMRGGFYRPYILGTTKHPVTQKKISFEYQWGEASIDKLLNNVDDCWKFPLAPWETTAHEGWFVLPKMK
ncbi:MAG: hypothetical protein ACK5NK_08435 [Niabella sp.]